METIASELGSGTDGEIFMGKKLQRGVQQSAGVSGKHGSHPSGWGLHVTAVISQHLLKTFEPETTWEGP